MKDERFDGKRIPIEESRRIIIGGRGNGKSMLTTAMIISEGNPGCMAFLQELIGIGEYRLFAPLVDIGLKGSRAYQLWNDCCDRDTEKAAEILRLYLDRKISAEEIHEHTDLPRGTAFDLEEIRSRVPLQEIIDIDLEFIRIMDMITPTKSEDHFHFTDEAIEKIHAVAAECMKTDLYKGGYIKGKQFAAGKYADELWMHLLLKIACAPTRLHMTGAVRALLPFVSDAIKAGRITKDGV